MWSKFFLLTYTLGPAATIPYATSFLAMHWIFIILFIAYTAPLPFLFMLMDKFHYKTSAEERLLSKLIGHPVKKAKDKEIMNKVYCSFVKRGGYLGHYIGVFAVAFTFGFLWAAVISYIMKLPRIRSFVSIGLGNIAGILFWIWIITQTKGFINPKWVIIIVLLTAFTFFLYGEIRERKVLEKIKEKHDSLLSKIKRS